VGSTRSDSRTRRSRSIRNVPPGHSPVVIVLSAIPTPSGAENVDEFASIKIVDIRYRSARPGNLDGILERHVGSERLSRCRQLLWLLLADADGYRSKLACCPPAAHAQPAAAPAPGKRSSNVYRTTPPSGLAGPTQWSTPKRVDHGIRRALAIGRAQGPLEPAGRSGGQILLRRGHMFAPSDQSGGARRHIQVAID
jgi:hypothetical protein